MPTVRYTSEGGTYRVNGTTFAFGDEHDVPEGLADHLVDDVGEFERVHENVTDVEFEEVDDSEGDGASDQEDEPAGDGVAFEGDNFAENGWLDNDYGDREEAVLAGGLDDHLDDIEAAETSETVIEAVRDRRDELEG